VELGAELAEIREDRPRKGLSGFLRSGFEAATKKATRIRPLGAKPEDFERTIVASPVWAGHLSSPVRAFLCDQGTHIAEFGVLLTHAAPSAKNDYPTVVAEAEKLIGKKSVFTRSVVGPFSMKK